MEEQEPQPAAGQDEPDLLYHYTTQGGLDGILSSNSIWATHYRFLNDSTERLHGLKLFNEALYRIASEKYRSSVAARTLADYFEGTTTNVLVAYIVSFCTDPEGGADGGDRLSQWRGYAHGTQGYCLVFGSELIREFKAATPQTNFSGLCIYSEAKQNDLCEKLSKDLLAATFRDLTAADLGTDDSLRKFIKSDSSKAEEWNNFALDALLLSTLFKHAGFREEREYRLAKFFSLKSDFSEIRCRSGRSNRTPYLAIPFALNAPSSPIRKIIVGPSANNELEAISLRIRLRQMGLTNVQVETSIIPFRG
jgi:hypothetical protein